MPATHATTIGKTARKNTLRLLLSFLAIFLTATFFVACGKSDDEGGGGGGGGKGSSEYKKGVASLEKKEYEDAVKSFKEAAEKGNVEAMVAYAACLGDGKGIEKDEDEAEKWLKKAADSGDAMAQALYGVALMKDEKDAEALDYLKKSADQDSVLGQFVLGATYLSKRKEADAKKGLDYLRKAANHSLTKEKTVIDVFKDEIGLDDVFSGASGVDIDLPEDKQNVSNVMIVMSQMLLGAVYMEQKDLAEAKKWLRKAGDNGLSQADDLLPLVEMAEKESKSKKR